jgi:exosortase/archaeosortase family protein
MKKQSKTKKENNKSAFKMSPVLSFILLALLYISLFIFLSSLNFVQSFLTQFTASFLEILLNALKVPVDLVNPVSLQLAGGTRLKFVIIPDCTGLYPFAILAGFILAFPAKKGKKLLGIIGAFLASFSVNYLRMISIMAIAMHSQRAFEIAHLLIWQTSFIILVLGYFFWWIRWK